MRTQWEYYVVNKHCKLHHELNELGAKGWELVSVNYADEDMGCELIFKRDSKYSWKTEIPTNEKNDNG